MSRIATTSPVSGWNFHLVEMGGFDAQCSKNHILLRSWQRRSGAGIYLLNRNVLLRKCQDFWAKLHSLFPARRGRFEAPSTGRNALGWKIESELTEVEKHDENGVVVS